eukprot:6362721-Ditylum_brightwellii.AAC.1
MEGRKRRGRASSIYFALIINDIIAGKDKSHYVTMKVMASMSYLCHGIIEKGDGRSHFNEKGMLLYKMLHDCSVFTFLKKDVMPMTWLKRGGEEFFLEVISVSGGCCRMIGCFSTS